MSFFAKLQARARHNKIQKLDAAEKRALVRFAYAVAAIDKDLAAPELAMGKELAVSLGVDFNDASKLGLPEAIEILKKKPAALELSCLVVADVLFADGVYNAAERKFVEEFASKFGVPQSVLQQTADRLAKSKVENALDEWHHEIVKDRS